MRNIKVADGMVSWEVDALRRLPGLAASKTNPAPPISYLTRET